MYLGHHTGARRVARLDSRRPSSPRCHRRIGHAVALAVSLILVPIAGTGLKSKEGPQRGLDRERRVRCSVGRLQIKGDPLEGDVLVAGLLIRE